MRACPRGLLKIGGGYIYVDVSGCEGCFSCVEACERAAIVRAPARPVALRSADSGKVVVGSRAEAKALRTAAQVAAKASVSPRERAAGPDAVITSSTRAAADGGPTVGWSLPEAAAVAFALLVAIVLKNAALDAPALVAMPSGARTASRVLLLVCFYAAQAGVLVALTRHRGIAFAEAFRIKTGAWPSGIVGSVGAVLVLVVGTRMASLVWGALARGAGWDPPVGGGSSFQSVFGGGGAGLALAVALTVVVGPITEELAFRGVIAQALDGRFGRRAAIVGSATLFAFYHLTPWQFVPMFVFGCALAWLSLTRSTLWPAIVLHSAYNGVVVAAAFWLSG